MLEMTMNHWLRVLLIATWALLSPLAGCTQGKEATPVTSTQAEGVTILYHGHSCFTIKDHTGFTVVIDPFDETVGYRMPKWKADAVLATHKHFDHCNVGAVECEREPVIERSGEVRVGPLVVKGVLAPHWTAPQFKARGDVAIYRWEQAGVALCHLGDLGQVLSEQQVRELKPVDVLFVPVGGNFTIGPAEAVTVIKQLDPAVVIPMHYRTAYCKFDIATVGDFLRTIPETWQVKQEAGNFIFVGPAVLSQLSSRPTVWVINP
jgi:L-ascorbate metabolism protein UlaG (beta-lactamase superfamily)